MTVWTIALPESTTKTDDSKAKIIPRNVRVVGWASLLNDTASEMIYPLLPHFLLTALGGNKLYLGIIEGVADSVASFVKLWSGSQSDRAGRRKGLIVFGYSVPAIVRPLTGLVWAPWQLFGIRVMDRIGKGIRSSPRDALIADSTPPSTRGRAFGFQRAMDNLGAAIGPLLAAGFLWLFPGQMRALFFVAFVPGVFVVVLLLSGLREPAASISTKQPLVLTLGPFDRNFRVYLLALIIFSLGNCSDTFLLVRAGELGVETVLLPVLWCVCHVAKSVSNYVLGRAIDRFGAKGSLVAGWLFFAIVYFSFGMASGLLEIWLCFVAYGVVYGLLEPAERALVGEIVGAERRGLAFGWFHFAIGIATFPSSLIFGALYQYFGPVIAFLCGAAMAFLASMLLTLVKVNSHLRHTA